MKILICIILLLPLILASCGEPEPVAEDIPTGGATPQALHALQVELYGVRAEYEALDAAYQSNQQTLNDLLEQWQKAQATHKRTYRDYELGQVNYATLLSKHSALQGEFLKKDTQYQGCADNTLESHDRLMYILGELNNVSNRQNITISSNLTSANQTIFYYGWDLWIATID